MLEALCDDPVTGVQTPVEELKTRIIQPALSATDAGSSLTLPVIGIRSWRIHSSAAAGTSCHGCHRYASLAFQCGLPVSPEATRMVLTECNDTFLSVGLWSADFGENSELMGNGSHWFITSSRPTCLSR